MAAVVAGSTCAIVLGVGTLVERFAKQMIVDRLGEAHTSFGRYLDSRYRLLETLAASFAETPLLKATLEIEDIDRATALVRAEEARGVLGVDFILLVDEQGRVLAHAAIPGIDPVTGDTGTGDTGTGDTGTGDTGTSDTGTDDHRTDPGTGDQLGARTALRGQLYSGLREDPAGVCMIAAAPVSIGTRLLGAIVVGEAIDSEIAAEFREAAAADVLVARGRRPLAWSSPSDGFRPEDLATAVDESTGQPAGVHHLHLDCGDRFVAVLRLGESTRLILSRTVSDLAYLQRSLWGWIIGFGFLAVLAAIVFSRWISRRLSLPLSDLAAAAGEIAQGNLSATVSELGMAETRSLGKAFNEMARRVEQLVADVRGKAEVLQQQKNELEWANQVKSSFLTNASHELRTPVTSNLSSAENLLHHGGDEDPATRQEFMAIIDCEANRLTQLVDQLLDLTALEAGESRFCIEEFDLLAAVDETVGAFRRGAGRGRSIATEYDCDVGAYLGDRSRLQQLLEQLLDNAAKFTPPDSPISIHLESTDTGIELRVADRGPGVPSAVDQRRIFDRFVQGGDLLTEKPAGVGLGLAIGAEIAAAHGGRLSYRDRDGGGAEFVLTLPTGSARLEVETAPWVGAVGGAYCSQPTDRP